MRDVLEALEGFWSAHDANVIATRRGPVSEEVLSRLQREHGPLPHDLTEYLRWEDGDPPRAFWLGLRSSWYLLPLSKIERNLMSIRRSRGILQSNDGEIDSVAMQSLIPFVLWNGGIIGAIDSESANSAVVGIDFENGTLSDWGLSFRGFFEQALDKLRSGKVLQIEELGGW